MAEKRGNPNWGKPELNTVPYAGATSFEEVAKRLRLSPQQYGDSTQLRDWAQKNKDHRSCHQTCSNCGVLWSKENPECRAPANLCRDGAQLRFCRHL